MAANAPPQRRYIATIFDISWSTAKCAQAVTYLRGQVERAPETGRLHWQVFFKVNRPMRIPAAQKALGAPNCHLKPCTFGDDKACEDYCTKEKTREPGYEQAKIGDKLEGQGNRTDIKRGYDTYERGGLAAVYRDLPEFAFKHAGMLEKYHRGRGMVMHNYNRKQVMVVFCQGAPRIGKTSGVFNSFDGRVYRLNPSDDGRIWFDGWDPEQHKILFIDDVPKKDAPGNPYKDAFWLRALDHYCYDAQIKGGHTRATWVGVILVSNHTLEECFGDDITSAVRQRIHAAVKGAGDEYWFFRLMEQAESSFLAPFWAREFLVTWNKDPKYPGETYWVSPTCPTDVCPGYISVPIAPTTAGHSISILDDDDGDGDMDASSSGIVTFQNHSQVRRNLEEEFAHQEKRRKIDEEDIDPSDDDDGSDSVAPRRAIMSSSSSVTPVGRKPHTGELLKACLVKPPRVLSRQNATFLRDNK